MVFREVRILLMLLATSSVQVFGEICDRTPEDTTKPRSPMGGKFQLSVNTYNRTDSPTTYTPDTKYKITLEGTETESFPQKFIKFMIVAENKDTVGGEIGTFEIEDSFTKFSHKCPNAVAEASKIPREAVTVAWISPGDNVGCISISATVVESQDIWYMDEDPLTVTLCRYSSTEMEPGFPLPTCCACDEAKYEVTFEGLWSKNTHPKDFPSNAWTTRFSDVIGASHTVDYRFWDYGSEASEGLRQVAERGATRMLESELKEESEHIRTIIKARGISYPNVTGKTFAVFRVDRKHHLMSLVSMIDPSPDWIVGVSGLELCLSNCSWMEHRELNLYPYDAGTDSGITYISPDSPTNPRERIQRITSTHPDDVRSPFYDESGMEMKPIAKLYLNRQRLYEKACDINTGEDPTGDDHNDWKLDPVTRKACKTSSWGKWGECSRTCGRGQKLRQRHYLDPEAAAAANCKRDLTGRSKCNVERCTGHQPPPGMTPEMCELENWGSWSSCTTTCGPGMKTQSRKFRHRKWRKYCMHNIEIGILENTIDCENEPCADGSNSDDEEVSETTEFDVEYDEGVTRSEEWLQKCPRERFSEWSMWSPCSSSCGPGVKIRSRLLNKSWSHLYDTEERDLEECKIEQASCEAEIPSCEFSDEMARSICSEPQVVGNCNGNILRVYFDSSTNECKMFGYTGCGGNRNNFPTVEDCKNVCNRYQRELRANLTASMKRFKVSVSSVLTYHVPVQEQRGGKTKRAKYNAEDTEGPDFGGIPSDNQVGPVTEEYSTEAVDCEFTEWSEWTSCLPTCKGHTYRNRTILQEARNGGKKCPKRLQQKRKCHKVPPCSLRRGMRRRSYSDFLHRPREDSNSVDCELSSWSPWSPCTATCGNPVRHRTRNVIVTPSGPDAKLCPSLVQFVTCPSVPCA